MNEINKKYSITPGYKPQAFDIIVKIGKDIGNPLLFIHLPDTLSLEEQLQIANKTNFLRETMVGHQPLEYFNEIETYFEMPANSLLNDYLNGILLTTLDHCYMITLGKYMDDTITMEQKNEIFESVLVLLLLIARNKIRTTLPGIVIWDVDKESPSIL